MKYLEEVYNIISSLGIAPKEVVGDILAQRGFYTHGTSATNNAYKRLKRLESEGRVVSGDGFFRLTHLKNNQYQEHSQALTEHLAEVLKSPYEPIIFREKLLPVNLRPDALVLLKNGNEGLCFVLEIMVNETKQSLENKKAIWRSWKGGREYLSELFGYNIKRLYMVTNEDFNEFIGGV